MTVRPIKRLLVANRGEIARRVFRTCRDRGIDTVAVFSDPDAGAAFVREADAAVSLGGASPAESYLRADAIVEAALAAGADAVHPGYGFLAENAGFARDVIAAGLTWVGPSPQAIEAMGSKIRARDLMEAAGIPVLPGATLGGEEDGPEEIGSRIGYPLIAKASAGGGGKGMRLVREAAELGRAVAAARREAEAAFGDGTLFLERFVERPRHVEIQIFGDAGGRVVSLFERDCSIQRRHQKVVEEAPSPAVDEALRERMGAAAVAAGESLGYVGAGTVEFLLAPDGSFFFLEVNTRLQVEHPVTELVTGLDLVGLQLDVAEGRGLPPEALSPSLAGHAVEVRLYAEDPANDFLPVTGRLSRFAVGDGVRVDTGVESGSEISPHYDPLVAKVIAHGDTRASAIRRLSHALRHAEVHGTTTNRDFLVRLLEHPEFGAGDVDTGFLERPGAEELSEPLLGERQERLHAAAAALAAQARRRDSAAVLRSLPSGWRNNPSQPQTIAWEGARGRWSVDYRFDRAGQLGALSVNGEELEGAVLHGCTPHRVDLQVDGLRTAYAVHPGDEGVHVNSPSGQADLRAVARFPVAEQDDTPGSLVSPLPGAVISLLVEPGAEVERGQALLTIEAMKMEHEIVAPARGRVSELLVGEGSQVQAGAVLAVIAAAEREAFGS